jgi:hypothetical protein
VNDRSGNANTALPVTSAPQLVPRALNADRWFILTRVTTECGDGPSIQLVGDVSSYAVMLFEDFNNYRALWAKTLVNQPASIDYYILPGSVFPVLPRQWHGQRRLG